MKSGVSESDAVFKQMPGHIMFPFCFSIHPWWNFQKDGHPNIWELITWGTPVHLTVRRFSDALDARLISITNSVGDVGTGWGFFLIICIKYTRHTLCGRCGNGATFTGWYLRLISAFPVGSRAPPKHEKDRKMGNQSNLPLNATSTHPEEPSQEAWPQRGKRFVSQSQDDEAPCKYAT